jgi:hypothetical protein
LGFKVSLEEKEEEERRELVPSSRLKRFDIEKENEEESKERDFKLGGKS